MTIAEVVSLLRLLSLLPNSVATVIGLAFEVLLEARRPQDSLPTVISVSGAPTHGPMPQPATSVRPISSHLERGPGRRRD